MNENGNYGPIWGANISPDGSMIAVVSGGTRIYDATNGNETAFFPGTPWRFAFSPDSKLLACGFDAEYDDSTALVQIWKLATNELVTEFDAFGAEGKFWGLQFSSDQGLLAGCSRASKIVKVWDTDKWTIRNELAGHTSNRNESVAFSPDNHIIVTGGNDGTVRTWSADDGRPCFVFDSHENDRITSVDAHPDGDRILSAGSKGEIKIWNRHDGTVYQTLVGEEYCNFAGFVGSECCVADGGGDLFFWDVSSGQLEDRIPAIPKRGHTIFGGANLSRDRSTIVTAGWHGTIKIWDARNRQLIREFGYDIEQDPARGNAT